MTAALRGTCTGLVGSAAVILALGGCASRGSVRELRGQVREMREQVEEVRKLQESTTQELAKTVGELKGLDAQVATLTQAQKGTAEKMEGVETRLTETDQAVRGIRTSLDGLSQEMVRRAAAPSPPDRPSEPERPPRSGPAEQLFATALANFRAREHGQAVLEFTDFIARYPQHALVANAQFWIGEAYYLQHDFRQALAEYQKVVDLDGKGSKAAEALFKIGLCFRALNQGDRARQTWQQLVQMYPDSDAARQARSLIQTRPAPVRRAR
ncbi:MAG: tol-pal system protein YbgF [Candidatus Rokubacteria bacterium]|nr:tol-pal system protein YbgF [Candidatus Rokubacteria bacterium]